MLNAVALVVFQWNPQEFEGNGNDRDVTKRRKHPEGGVKIVVRAGTLSVQTGTTSGSAVWIEKVVS